jgi:hypothetical protein
MVEQEHALRQMFHELVGGCYDQYLGMHDAEVSTYVADLLTEFCASDKVYRVRDAQGKPMKDVVAMLAASDPVLGTAPSFDAEREIRKHIGDYALFFAGMYPESMHLWRQRDRESFLEMVRAGKESYYVVSQFNVFEYALEAPLFTRLSENYELCIYGLNMVRSEMDRRHAIPPPQKPKLLM